MSTPHQRVAQRLLWPHHRPRYISLRLCAYTLIGLTLYPLLYTISDEAIGRVTRHARAMLGDDLVVVVSSDNGASTWEGGLNYPLRSGKFSPFEGTIPYCCYAEYTVTSKPHPPT